MEKKCYEDMTVDTRDWGRKNAEKIIKDLRQRRDEITVELCALKDLLERINEIDKIIEEEIIGKESTVPE